VPYIFRGAGEVKIRAADSDSGPSVVTRDAQPMNSQPGKLSVLTGRVVTGGVTPVVLPMLNCFCCDYILPSFA
jgi:hypothetical protein